MPKLNQAVPKYCKHKASGQAVVSIGGVDHYLGPHGTLASRTEYDRIIAEFLAAGRNASIVNGGGRTVAQVLSPFWQHAKQYYVKNGKPTSEVSAFRQVIETLSGLYAETPADEFGPLALKTVRELWIRVIPGVRTVRTLYDGSGDFFWAVRVVAKSIPDPSGGRSTQPSSRLQMGFPV